MFDFVPWPVWAIIVAVVVLAVYRFFGIRQSFYAAAVLAAALFYRKGRDDGRGAEKDRIERARTAAMRDKKESDDAVDSLDGEQLDAEYRRWLRRD